MNILAQDLKRLVCGDEAMTESAVGSEAPHSAVRADEYALEVVPLILHFQRAIEAAPNCDYDALRAALRWARQTYLPVTMSTLCAAYCIACRPTLHPQYPQDAE
jgi:hypothetical protein